MVFSRQENTNFFQNAPQMGLSAVQYARLSAEGLATVEAFLDFEEDDLDSAARNLRVAIPAVPAVMDAVDPLLVVLPPVPAIPACTMPANCLKRLKIASVAYHYYISIGREPTPANMNFTRVLRSFHIESEAIKKLAKQTKPDVPVLNKNTPPTKWLESFRDCLYRTYGVRGASLSYVIREEPLVPAEVDDPLVAGSAFGSSGSVLEELIKRLAHTHPLFKSDDAAVSSLLEEAARGTRFEATIKTFTKRKQGRNAYLAIVSSHAGVDKWETIQKDKLNWLMSSKWNGRQNSLEIFTSLHRSAYAQLEEASEYVNFQIPNVHSRVGYLIDNITHNDPDLRAAIASIRLDSNGMRDDFEGAVACLLPVCPYQKYKRTNGKERSQRNISEFSAKAGKGDTGVEYRWYKKPEYEKLNKEQRVELYAWQQSREGKEATKKRSSGNFPNPKDNAAKEKKAMRKTIKSLMASNSKVQQQMDQDMLQIASALAVPKAQAPTGRAAAPPPAAAAPIVSVVEGIVQRIADRKRKISDTDDDE